MHDCVVVTSLSDVVNQRRAIPGKTFHGQLLAVLAPVRPVLFFGLDSQGYVFV